MRKKKNTELHKLFAKVEALPPETRAGIGRFLELVLSLKGELEEYASSGKRSEDFEEDLCELQGLLERDLQGGSPVRRCLAHEVFACAKKACALDQADSARLLLQIGIVVAAGQEQLASFLIQDAACDAALGTVRSAVS